jgi:hypothetical protein
MCGKEGGKKYKKRLTKKNRVKKIQKNIRLVQK